METLEHLADITKMGTVYGHVDHDGEITNAVKVNGNKEYMGKLAAMMHTGDLVGCIKAHEEGKWEPYHKRGIPYNQNVYVIYLPPYYLFTDQI
jgi:hypothetical protein